MRAFSEAGWYTLRPISPPHASFLLARLEDWARQIIYLPSLTHFTFVYDFRCNVMLTLFSPAKTIDMISLPLISNTRYFWRAMTTPFAPSVNEWSADALMRDAYSSPRARGLLSLRRRRYAPDGSFPSRLILGLPAHDVPPRMSDDEAMGLLGAEGLSDR